MDILSSKISVHYFAAWAAILRWSNTASFPKQMHRLEWTLQPVKSRSVRSGCLGRFSKARKWTVTLSPLFLAGVTIRHVQRLIFSLVFFFFSASPSSSLLLVTPRRDENSDLWEKFGKRIGGPPLVPAQLKMTVWCCLIFVVYIPCMYVKYNSTRLWLPVTPVADWGADWAAFGPRAAPWN